MASGVGAPQDGGQRLPALYEGRSNLVSSATVPQHQTSTPREWASQWAAEVRRNITMYVERHEDVNEDDVMALKQELISVFIATLQQDSRSAWVYLCEVLQLLEGYREYLDYFETRAEFHHYLERIMNHLHLHRERLFDLQVEQSLTRVFPEEIQLLKSLGPKPLRDYCTVTETRDTNTNNPTSMTATRGPRKAERASQLSLPDGTNPYSGYIKSDEEVLAAQGLTFGDIHKSLGNVAFEMSSRESIWNHCLGTTALALSTNIPEELQRPHKPVIVRPDRSAQRFTCKQKLRSTPRKEE